MRIEINGTMHTDLIEAAKVLEIHPEHLRRLHRYGDIPAMKLERGLYFPLPTIEDRLYQKASSDTKK